MFLSRLNDDSSGKQVNTRLARRSRGGGALGAIEAGVAPGMHEIYRTYYWIGFIEPLCTCICSESFNEQILIVFR